MNAHCRTMPCSPSSRNGAFFILKHARFHFTIDMAAQVPRSQSSRLWSLGVLQWRLYRRLRDVDHLEQQLVEEWRHFNQDIIDRAVGQWRVTSRPISYSWTFQLTRMPTYRVSHFTHRYGLTLRIFHFAFYITNYTIPHFTNSLVVDVHVEREFTSAGQSLYAHLV